MTVLWKVRQSRNKLGRSRGRKPVLCLFCKKYGRAGIIADIMHEKFDIDLRFNAFYVKYWVLRIKL